jgi:hypothetical protein
VSRFAKRKTSDPKALNLLTIKLVSLVDFYILQSIISYFYELWLSYNGQQDENYGVWDSNFKGARHPALLDDMKKQHFLVMGENFE